MSHQLLKISLTILVIISYQALVQAQGLKLIPTSNISQWFQGQNNVGIEIQPNKRVSKWSILGELTYKAGTRTTSSFEDQYVAFSFSGDLRIFPAGTHTIYFSTQKNIRAFCNGQYSGCIQNFFGRKKNVFADIMKGTYLSLGYFNERLMHEFVPAASLESPITKFPVEIREEGVKVGLGYQVHFYNITLEAGAQWLLGIPRELGSSSVFHENLYTSMHPFPYRIRQRTQIRIGIGL